MNYLIKLTNTTFKRKKGDYIYLFNQLNYNERYYDEDSNDFINTLSKKPKEYTDIIDTLLKIYDVNRATLEQDYLLFIKDLEQDSFVSTGKTISEINSKESVFTYKNWNTNSVNNLLKDKEINNESNIVSIPNDINNNELYIENLYLEITRRCNEHCVHCYIPEEQRKTGGFMPLEKAKSYLDQAKELKVWKISLTGGEPFLHKDINEIISYARKKDFIISILSNLSVLQAKHIKVLKENYIALIQVSLYSLQFEIHDAITGLKGSFNKTFNNIKLCIENDIPVQINCPVVDLNKNDYLEVKKWGIEHGLKVNIDFYILAQTDNKSNNLDSIINQNDIKDTYKTFLSANNDINKDILLPINLHSDTLDTPVCEAGRTSLYIASTGKVKPCSVWQSMEVGDLSTASLKDIYYNSSKIKAVRSIKKSDFKEMLNADFASFIMVCPAHNANIFHGDYKRFAELDIDNAKLRFEATKEFFYNSSDNLLNNNTLIRLTKDSFIRFYETHGYITNQLIKNDRLFNETGADFLSVISREAKSVSVLVDKLLGIYEGVDRENIQNDFITFVKQLETDGFLITGLSEEELKQKEPFFTYKTEDVKTNKKFFSDDFKSEGTSEFIYKNLINEHLLNSLTIELTKQCNERCVHCYLPNQQKQYGKTLPAEKIKEIINEAVKMGLLSITFTGGEPFLHKDIIELLQYARKKDLMINILSNLTLLSKTHIALLKEINISMIQVSLYSLNADTHNYITQLPGSFTKTMNAIKLLIENDVPVVISCPVMKHNYADYKEVLKWARKNRILANTDLDLSAQTDFNDENLSHSTTYKQNKDLLTDMLSEDKEWQNVLLNEYAKGIETKADGEQVPCSVGNDSLFISAEAYVYPCPSWQSFKIADLNKSSLYDTWNNNEQTNHLRKIKRKDFPEFMNSPYREFATICMARNANNNKGEYMKMDTKTLEVAQMTKELVDDFVKQYK